MDETVALFQDSFHEPCIDIHRRFAEDSHSYKLVPFRFMGDEVSEWAMQL